MSHPERPGACPCACPGLHTSGPSDAHTRADPTRRATLKSLAGAALCAGGLAPARAADGPVAGDALVLIDGEPTPLSPGDIQLGAKPVFAWPWDPAARRARDGTRLNKVLLLRVDPSDLDPATKALAVDGVVAYSGVCTHQGCDVNAWRAAEKTLLCFCHFSQFQPAHGAAVVAGPAPRPLPGLPLGLESGRLVVTGPFTATPGGANA